MREVKTSEKDLGWTYCKKCKLRVPFVFKKTGYCNICTILFGNGEVNKNS